MLSSPLQLLNARASIDATLSGVFTLLRFLQYINAPTPIVFTVSGTEYSVSVFPAGYCIRVVLFLLNSTPSLSV